MNGLTLKQYFTWNSRKIPLSWDSKDLLDSCDFSFYTPDIYGNVNLVERTGKVAVLDYVIEEKDSILLVKKFFGGGKTVKKQEDKKDRVLRRAVDYLREKFREDLRDKKLYGFLYNSAKKEGRVVEFS